MMNQRKKKIIIILVVLLILLIGVGVGGYFAYVYTDLFKSNETLFQKYAFKALDSIKYIDNKQLAEVDELKAQRPYEMIGDISLGMETNNETVDIAKLDMQINANEADDERYCKFDISAINKKLLTLEYAHSNNIYALKSDEIVNAFIGIENDNLKVLAQKLGITDTTQIPNKIETPLKKDISFTDEELEYIRTTYLDVLKNSINKDKYTKEPDSAIVKDGKSYKTTGYRLKLSYEEIKQIEIKLLETLSEDSRTLNMITTRAKALNMEEEYTEIESLTESIKDLIETIKADTETGDGIVIMLYVSGGEIISTEMIVRNELKYTFYGTSTDTMTKRYMLIENLDVNSDYGKIELNEQETRQDGESTFNLTIKSDDKISLICELKLTGNENTGIKTTGNISYSANDEINSSTYNIEYNSQLTFKDDSNGIVKLGRNNCGILNDYDKQTIETLLNQIMQRAGEVFLEKIQLLGYGNLGLGSSLDIYNNGQDTIYENSEMTTQEKQAFNSKFNSYEGQITGSKLKALKTMVENSNIANMENQVTLIIDGQRSFGNNVIINANANYRVQMSYNDNGIINEIIANSL